MSENFEQQSVVNPEVQQAVELAHAVETRISQAAVSRISSTVRQEQELWSPTMFD